MSKETVKTIEPPAGADILGIKYFALSAIKGLGKNFKTHDREAIAASIAKRGLITAIGIDELSDENFDGNGRVEALQFLKERGDQPPKKVLEHNGEWFIPVLTGVAFETEAERVAAAATLNRLNERGGYDEKLAAEILQYLQAEDALDATGFEEADVAALLEKYEPELQASNDLMSGGEESDEGEKKQEKRQPRQTSDDYTAFNVVMTPANKNFITSTLHVVRQTEKLETLEDALVFLSKKYMSERGGAE